MPFRMLRHEQNHYLLSYYKAFGNDICIEWEPESYQSRDTLFRIVEYAMNCSFYSRQDNGYYRPDRGEGNHPPRRNGEIFGNILLGKLGEFATYYSLCRRHIVQQPNITDLRGYNNWDSVDLRIDNNVMISIKATNHNSNLLLLPRDNYNNEGEYIPNIGRGNAVSRYDYFVLARVGVVQPDGELKSLDTILNQCVNGIGMRNTISDNERTVIIEGIVNSRIRTDVAGFVSREQFVEECIEATPRHLIYQTVNLNNQRVPNYLGRSENNRTRVDVDNYYIQAGDLQSILLL